MFCSTPTTKPTTEEEDKNQQPPLMSISSAAVAHPPLPIPHASTMRLKGV
jgi:hypothetical protein